MTTMKATREGADRLLLVREVAGRLGVSTRQVWKLQASGRLPRGVKLARSIRWRESDIARFIACSADMHAFAAQSEVRP